MYKPGPISISELAIQTELNKISEETKNGQVLSITFIEHSSLPAKPAEGIIMRFAANIVAPATARGLYEYVGGAWVKL